jgi:acyl carrier protein
MKPPTDAVAQRLIELAARRFAIPAAQLAVDDDFFDDLGIDSYQAMDLLSEIEKQFRVEIAEHEIVGVTTFAQLAKLVAAKL